MFSTLLLGAWAYAQPQEQLTVHAITDPSQCLLLKVKSLLAQPNVRGLRMIVRNLPREYREYLERIGEFRRGENPERSLAEGVGRFLGDPGKVVAEIHGAKVIFRSTDPAIGLEILEDVNRKTYRVYDFRARMYLDWEGHPRVPDRADASHEGQSMTHFDNSTFRDEGTIHSFPLEAELEKSQTSRIFLIKTSPERQKAIQALDWNSLNGDERALLQLTASNVQMGTKYEIDALMSLAEKSQDPSWIPVLRRWQERLNQMPQDGLASWRKWILVRISGFINSPDSSAAAALLRSKLATADPAQRIEIFKGLDWYKINMGERRAVLDAIKYLKPAEMTEGEFDEAAWILSKTSDGRSLQVLDSWILNLQHAPPPQPSWVQQVLSHLESAKARVQENRVRREARKVAPASTH